MRTTTRQLSTLAAVVVAGLALHTPVAAQGTLLLKAPALSAAQLESEAHQPVMNSKDWFTVARELEQAAKLRPANDPMALTDLIGAATLYTSLDRPTVALSILDGVGRRAEKMGANNMAARAYLGAIPLAMQLQQGERTQFYVDRLRALAKRPGLTPDEERAIRGQVGHSGGNCN